jgi:hypothetical protein
MPEGIIVEVMFARYPHLGFRQAYRWTDVQLRGRVLRLPKVSPRTPRWLRLSASQFDRIAPRVPPA